MVTEFFSVAGAEKTFIPRSREEARTIFSELLKKEDSALIVIEKSVSLWLDDLINKHISEKKRPLIITLQSPKKEYKENQLEDIVRLIEKVTGVKIEI